jgi:N-acetyl-gamma-glutamyl-phosphate reductase
MYKVGVLGATGYTGAVLLSILSRHRDVSISLVTSNTYKEKKISDIFPAFRGRIEKRLEPTDADYKGACDIFFLCLPHGTAAERAKALYDGQSLLVDLSADLRFENADLYEKYYVPHQAKELLPKAVYGLPELHLERIRNAKLIGNPGCYPTSAILALYPLVKNGFNQPDVFVDSKSGVSGAGREAKVGSLFTEVSEGFRAYNVGTHRHQPEIQKELAKFGNANVAFVPHLLPMNRGILTTVYGRLTKAASTDELLDLYRKAYENAPFVRILDQNLYPDTRNVRFSNYCDIGLKVFEDGRFVVISAIDNLVKGASGQAVQNMNIALGLREVEALDLLPQYP